MEWISVKDRFPKDSGETLIFVKNPRNPLGVIVVRNYCVRLKYWDKCMDKNTKVTHWKPLPNPPKP